MHSDMRTLTKANLTDSLVETIGLTHRDALALVDTFFNDISAALINGETVNLLGFGNFTLRQKVARPGRNPKTGESAFISARTVVTFKPSAKLTLAIQSANPS